MMPGQVLRAAALLLVALPAVAQTPSTHGNWTPLSRALEPLGPLVLDAGRIRWSICRGASVARVDADKGGAVYTLQGQPGCVLDGQPVTHLKLAPRAGRCDAELTLFSGEKAWREAAPEAWGLVERLPCP